MSQSYYTPDGSTEILYEIKKSKFIARLCKAIDRTQAMEVLEQENKTTQMHAITAGRI